MISIYKHGRSGGIETHYSFTPIGENKGVGIGFLRVRATLKRCNLPQTAALVIPNALFEEYQKIVLSDRGYVLGLTTVPDHDTKLANQVDPNSNFKSDVVDYSSKPRLCFI